MIKILVATAHLSKKSGGLFYSVKELSAELSKNPKFNVEIIGFKDDSYDNEHWKGLNVKTFNTIWPLHKFGLSISYFLYLLRTDARVVHLHGIWNFAALAVYISSIFKSFEIIISPRGMLDTWILARHSRIKKIYSGFVENKLLKKSKFIHALNESEERAILDYLPNSNVIVFPNGISQTKRSSSDFIKSLKENKLVFIGRLDPKKGVIELIQAFSYVNPKDWSLYIYGWGEQDYINKLHRLANESRSASIFIMGSCYGEAKEEVLLSTSAFVLPSYSEGLPMSVLEAWSFGLPVLMTDECNLSDSFSINAAFKVNIASLASDLAFFFDSYEEQAAIYSENSLKLVNDRYLWKDIAKKMAAYYE